MSTYEFWTIILSLFSVTCTLLIAVIAIWQDKLRPKPKLSLELKNPVGVAVQIQSGGDVHRYFHLRVRNLRPWAPARQVRVMLRQVLRPDVQGEYVVSSAHNFQLTWSPAYAHDFMPTISSVDELDLGFISRGTSEFTVPLYGCGSIREATLRPNESVVIGLDVVAENYASSKLHMFRIVWSGQWQDDDSKVAREITITDITDRKQEGAGY